MDFSLPVATTSSDAPPASTSSAYFARYGTAVLACVSRPKDDMALHGELVEAIRADSRVVAVSPGAMNPAWTSGSRMYPAYGNPGPDVLLSGSDQFFSIRFSDGILFEVRVPSKNQPLIYNERPEPEHYVAAWDGVTVVVMWANPSNQDRPDPAAGQIILTILEEAAERTLNSLYVQPCSANCELLFGHMPMKVTHVAEQGYDDQVTLQDDIVNVDIRGALDSLALVEAVHDLVKLPAAEFAHLKNLARRIIDIEYAARLMTIELIAIDYQNLKASQKPFFARIFNWFLERWASVVNRSSARRAKYLIASLWLAMASIETLQQSHSEDLRDFDDSVHGNPGVAALFGLDLKSDEAVVASIDVSFARAAIEHKSLRMDSNLIVSATVGGAVAGGAVGGAIAWLAAISSAGGH